jgi:CelD/BcsL family acetyltransferase involved in cellulose biosynthesis
VETKDKIAVGSAIGLSFNGRIVVPAAGSLPEFFPLAPNDLLYWGILEFACKNGFSLFDFGRSPWKSGHFEFKRGWGAEIIPLYYHRWSLKGNKSQISTTDTLRQSSIMQMISNLWKRCPYPVVKVIGPHLMKHFP